ncbi:MULTISPECIES: hypothetical protein [Corynebacterium]|uniref:hypothetical protein n=1 Tax=Corynebacterium TaxID=1716 RepID=UPI00178C6B69|nr:MULTISPECIES: hypothetical protein [Corynebacterium]
MVVVHAHPPRLMVAACGSGAELLHGGVDKHKSAPTLPLRLISGQNQHSPVFEEESYAS